MRALTLGLSALACTVALLAMATSATAEQRGQRDWNKAEESGWRDSHRGGYSYRRYDGPYVYYGATYYDPYYYPPYPYYYAPAPYYGSSVSFSFGF
jgi:hypothetical protein